MGSLLEPKECRWGWCTETFETTEELVEHIRQHCRSCSPIRYGDWLKLRQRDERQEANQSISTGIPSSLTQRLTQDSARSLPSPTSSEDDSMSVDGDDESIIPQMRYHSRSRTPLTFGALASPRATPQPMSAPASPAFNQLVANATRGTKRKLNESLMKNNSQSSDDSTQSRDSVAQQLTQMDESDSDDDCNVKPEDNGGDESLDQTYDGELNWSPDPRGVVAPTRNRSTSSQSSPSPSRHFSPEPVRIHGRNPSQPSNASQMSLPVASQVSLKHDSFPTGFQPQQWYSVYPLSLGLEEDADTQQDTASVVSRDSSRLSPSPLADPRKKDRQDSSGLLDIDYEDYQNSRNLGESFPVLTQALYQSQDDGQGDSFPLMTQAPYDNQFRSQ
ncbi:hypothetical protein K435DRAFT_847246 [Dendrothele bispora CBS 962.96]|uniref:C2H2-type domain-containing protein n=1 Tax=Dendrothele bispora (strain CBS 962.96) TaxID=1314807 RepID=A0A4S8MY82_DENBC|nr:hypothetical protein K435DRAFT_847246 [Dendrothele bispora CBS 962.96]